MRKIKEILNSVCVCQIMKWRGMQVAESGYISHKNKPLLLSGTTFHKDLLNYVILLLMRFIQGCSVFKLHFE